jgi:hypothetical protein
MDVGPEQRAGKNDHGAVRRAKHPEQGPHPKKFDAI